MTKKEKADYQKKWRQNQSNEWKDANRVYMRHWHSLNRDKSNKSRKARYLADPKKHQEGVKRAIEKRKLDPIQRDVVRAIMKHRRKAGKARRRMSVKGTDKPMTYSEWLALLAAWDNRCAYCANLLDKPTQDHVIPVTKGGQHTMDNVLPACMRCNQLKGTKELGDFLVSLYQLLGGDPWKSLMPK